MLDEVAAHARDALPAECCGVLLGRANEIVEIIEAVRTRNVSENPNRYSLDPKDHIEARRTARMRGLAVIGFYHSHPHSEPEPSIADLSEATYPGHVYLIVRPRGQGAKVRLFRFEPDGFLEVGFVVGRPGERPTASG